MAGGTNTIGVRTKNLKALQAILREGGSSLPDDTLRKVFFDAVSIIHKRALENVQRLFRRRTGNLERWLIAEPGHTYAKKPSAWTKVRGGGDQAPHAHLLEFGHKVKIGSLATHLRLFGIKGVFKSVGGYVQGRPFFRPAVDASIAEVKSLIAGQVKACLTNAMDHAGHTPEDVGWVG